MGSCVKENLLGSAAIPFRIIYEVFTCEVDLFGMHYGNGKRERGDFMPCAGEEAFRFLAKRDTSIRGLRNGAIML